MTLTPATKEALDRLSRATEANLLADASDINQMVRLANQEKDAQAALLSVVAAEEGRKYEELVKLHREWVEATKAVKDHDFGHAYHLGGDPEGAALVAAAEAALSALAQWETK